MVLLKPLLHTWSLSVEEQYYILFPIILITIFKFFKKYLLGILFLGFFISLLMAEWGSKNYPAATFYFFTYKNVGTYSWIIIRLISKYLKIDVQKILF